MTEPWVRFEDEHLLVVTKPAGVNTHRADPVGQDGMHEWVQRQRPGASLSILHRLDKATSGLLVFGKTADANQALTAQFADRTVDKRYELLVEADVRRAPTARCDEPLSSGSRAPGPRSSGQPSRGPRAGGARGSGRPSPGSPSSGSRAGRDAGLLEAVTDFERSAASERVERWDAHPRTGRTHQVRVHAAALGMPILGDTEHGGGPAARLFLHAASLAFDHPVAGALNFGAPRPVSFDQVLGGAPPDDPGVAALAALEARAALFDPADTDAYLWIDREHDGFAGVRVERLGDVAVVRSYDPTGEPLPPAWLDAWSETIGLRAIYEQRRPRGGAAEPARLVRGRAGEQFAVTEVGCRYLIDLAASATSTGLFLDQRETRRRLLSTDLAGRTVLNAFAHTGSLSVAAARAGAETLTLDLSTRYLDWARDNLRANDLDPADHDFIYGDALEWMARLAKKGRTFDVVLVDPPSSSTSKKKGTKRWVVERDLAELVERSIELCASGGTVFVSTNLHRMRWPRFLEHVDVALLASGRTGRVETQTLPLDHRTGPGDPPYLKAAWIHLDD